MDKNIINKVLDSISKELDIDKNVDVITELFISREDELHDIYRKTKASKEISESLKKLSDEISKEYENDVDILAKFDEYSDLSYQYSYACEKLMYRLGVSDALILMLELANKIDLEKFIKDNI